MSFTKAFILFLSFVLSTYALATPHVPRGLHRALAARLPVDPLASADPTAPVRKRQNKRCRPRSSTVILSSAGQPTKVLVPSAVTTHRASATTFSHEVLLTTTLEISTSKEAEPPMTTQKPPTSSIKEAEPPATTKKPSSTPSPTKEAEPPVTTKKPSPTPSPTKEAEPPVTTKKPSPPPSSNLPSFMVGTQKGEGTFYSTGLGACGVTNKDTDHIAAVSYLLFDAFPNYNGVNPNDNPVCGRKITATYGDKSVTVAITDRCTGCEILDLDFSPSAFDELADPSVGRLFGVTWEWLE